MGIEDIPRIGKAAKAAKTATKVDRLVEVVVYEGVRYRFPKGTTEKEAYQWLWNHVRIPQVKGVETKIDLPSELPPERLDEIAKMENPPKADVIPFKKTSSDIWDETNGLGAFPDWYPENQSYFNIFKVQMTPDEFLSHATELYPPSNIPSPTLLTDNNAKYIRGKLEAGSKFAPPYLSVKWDGDRKVWDVMEHEGRHRSAYIKDRFGADTKMPVLIRPYDESGYPIKGEGKITDEMRKAPIVGVGAAAGAMAVPKKMEPGVYFDEDSGKYWKIDKDGNMVELE